jgi:hypothetical protein
MSTEVTILWESSDLRDLDDRVDTWLVDLVDDAVDFAANRLRDHAPGRIGDFVMSDGPQGEPQFGMIEGMAGVTPDPLEGFVSKRGSKRADFPYYVDVGTGVYGEHHSPITSFPPNHMGPVEWRGQMVYFSQIRGQQPQDYSGEATRDTDAWLPEKIRESSKKI